MKKERIEELKKDLTQEDLDEHESKKFIRGYKLAVHRKNLKDQLKIK